MTIEFDVDDVFAIKYTIKELGMLTIIVRSVFQQGKKLYPQIYLDECLYEL